MLGYDEQGKAFDGFGREKTEKITADGVETRDVNIGGMKARSTPVYHTSFLNALGLTSTRRHPLAMYKWIGHTSQPMPSHYRYSKYRVEIVQLGLQTPVERLAYSPALTTWA
jgi:hypothetical protein